MNKNGLTLAAGAAAVMLILVIGVTAVVGISINNQMQTNLYSQVSIVNESQAGWANNTYEALTNSYAISVTEVINSTLVIGSGNYTLLGNVSGSSIWMHFNGTSDGVNADNFQTGDYNVSYTYYSPTDATRAAANSTLGIQQITSQLTLVGLIVVMAIVIGLLFGAFGGMMTAGKI